jgi:hypothetical protein
MNTDVVFWATEKAVYQAKQGGLQLRYKKLILNTRQLKSAIIT